jgi:SRSO17 transposase
MHGAFWIIDDTGYPKKGNHAGFRRASPVGMKGRQEVCYPQLKKREKSNSVCLAEAIPVCYHASSWLAPII